MCRISARAGSRAPIPRRASTSWRSARRHGPRVVAVGHANWKRRVTAIWLAAANNARSILPEGHFTSDTRQLLFYFRRDHTNRFIMGGRGPFREPKGPQDWAHLERIAVKLFPQLKDVPIEFRWCGRVTLTRDFL